MRTEPRASYRVQLRREFDFAAAAGVVPYLSELGISHLYCSPYMAAARGSTHGYDVVDPTRVNPELGGDGGLAQLDHALLAHSMGQLLDIVPNHMCVADPRNVWWWDVLRLGRDSPHASFFDIDWAAPGLEGRVVLPVLGDTLDAILGRGELRLLPQDAAAGEGAAGDGAADDGPVLAYYEHRFPLAPRSVEGAADGVTPQLLARQHYSLEYWRTGITRINYRRFFDISSLAAVRAELPGVHRTTHERALELVGDGAVDGLRVDHIDGLHDPGGYAATLRSEAPDAWLLVEKILGPHERLPGSWPIDGTTGYEAAARLTGLHVDRNAREALLRLYTEFTGDMTTFAEHAREGRRLAVETLLGAELDRLARASDAAGIAGAREELAALIAAMPVYRLYPREWEALSAEDESQLEAALNGARAAMGAAGAPAPTPGQPSSAKARSGAEPLAAIGAVLRGQGEMSAARTELRTRFQQLSAAATAKGVEDTAFYRYVPLVALNEVGADPDCFGIDTAAFHEVCADAAASAPRALVSTASHDTKRGEDARLRIAMLSEMPEAWASAVDRWHGCAERHRGERAPSRGAEYLFFQTMVAAHPISADRCAAYMHKAAREAKQETSWLDVDAGYEAELDAFVRGMLADPEFVRDVDDFLGAMTPAWQVASLSQTLLKCVYPGVPDIYQGSELWELSLVDPDNRRPVDYGSRRQLLKELDGMHPARMLDRADSGLPKLHVIRQALAVRARHPMAFAPGSGYRGVEAHGTRAANAVACARSRAGEDADVVAVAVRLAYGLKGAWGDTSIDLPGGGWQNVLTREAVDGGRIAVADLLRTFPVALLERAP